MDVTRKAWLMAGSAAAFAALPLVIQPLVAQPRATSGPVARYDMRAGTITGAAAMGRGAGAAMSMMFGGGGGNAVQHELYLRLGSAQGPDKAAPKADHFMPPAARLGKSVPLLTPREEKGGGDEMPQKPKGRLLVYWGCGEHVAKGQPIVIDFAKIAAGQVPAGLWTGTILRDWGPSLSNSRAFGRWPNEDATGGNRQIKPDASLIGPHRIAGNYSPEIAFSLTKDFMGGLQTSTSKLPSNAQILRWNSLPDATGYYAMLFGGKMGPNGEMGDMVMWSSSSSRQFGGGLADWLSPGQVNGLVSNGTVIAPTRTSCTIPVEVRDAAPDFRVGTLTAYGPEEDFVYPSRPADPKAAWNIQWTARIRHRSMTSWMDMPGGMGQSGMTNRSDSANDSSQQKCKPKRGLGGLIGGGLLGGSGGC